MILSISIVNAKVASSVLAINLKSNDKDIRLGF